MHLIVGLGNPGNQYQFTRHNIGFLVVDELAKSAGVTFKPGKGEFWFAHCSLKNTDVTLLKPLTYMNNSGIAVLEFLEQDNIAKENILIVCDELQLTLGTIRLRPNGSDGGHNGLSSVIYHLQTEEVPRLRCGIGQGTVLEEPISMKDFVLESFADSEIQSVEQMIKNAADACITFISEGISSAMNRHNATPTQEIS
jgi:PTH1 family peptidyl-tRNA hydrolase